MKDLRAYVDLLKQSAPDQLRVVNDAISWEYDVTSYYTEMERLKSNPALLFNNVNGSSIPIIVNLLGSIDRMRARHSRSILATLAGVQPETCSR